MVVPILLIFTSVFLGVFVFVYAGAMAGQSPASRLKSRLQRMAAGEQRERVEAVQEFLQSEDKVEAFCYRLPLMKGAKRMVEAAGLNVSPIFFVLWSSLGCVVCFVAAYLWRGSAIIALGVSLTLALCIYIYLAQRKHDREIRFTEQLPDALTMIARSLRAGHSLAGAVELISQELPEPSASLFRLAYEQQKLGMRMADALAKLPEKIESMDLRFFVTIIRINSEAGGNLAEVLDKLAETIRQRLQIRRQVQVLTAEGRVSGYVLVALPVAVFFMFNMLRPSYMQVFFTDETCRNMLIGAAVAQVVGFLFIRKIINIRI